jgi:hypothetical protein
MKKLTIALLAIITISACKTKQLANTPANYPKLYRTAIKNAMYPETDKIDDNLIAITHENKNLIRKTINGEEHILVVTWKTQSFYPDSGKFNTTKWPIWVSIAPELLNRMEKEKFKDTNMRLKQLLGLPPLYDYKLFVEFWVRPKDLFRPCPDKEITDTKCNTCFTKQDSLDMDYVNWVNNTRLQRYYQCALYAQYPWTSLGYTYDWNPKNRTHFGLSEFVIGENKNIYVKKIYSTAEYFKKGTR